MDVLKFVFLSSFTGLCIRNQGQLLRILVCEISEDGVVGVTKK